MTARIDRDKVARELVKLLDEADRREEALREHNKSERDSIAALRAQAGERRDIIADRQGVQLSIGHTRDEAAAVEALDGARKVAKKKEAPATCHDCGESAKRPGGALTTEGFCWDCHVKRHPEDEKKVRKPRAVTVPCLIQPRALCNHPDCLAAQAVREGAAQ